GQAARGLLDEALGLLGDHTLVVVAADRHEAGLAHELDALHGVGPEADHVAEAHDALDPARADVVDRRAQRLVVAVDAADDRVVHGAARDLRGGPPGSPGKGSDRPGGTGTAASTACPCPSDRQRSRAGPRPAADRATPRTWRSGRWPGGGRGH